MFLINKVGQPKGLGRWIEEANNEFPHEVEEYKKKRFTAAGQKTESGVHALESSRTTFVQRPIYLSRATLMLLLFVIFGIHGVASRGRSNVA